MSFFGSRFYFRPQGRWWPQKPGGQLATGAQTRGIEAASTSIASLSLHGNGAANFELRVGEIMKQEARICRVLGVGRESCEGVKWRPQAYQVSYLRAVVPWAEMQKRRKEGNPAGASQLGARRPPCLFRCSARRGCAESRSRKNRIRGRDHQDVAHIGLRLES